MKFKTSAMKIYVFLILLAVVPAVEAQKKKPVKKAVPRVFKMEENLLTIPEIKDFAFVVEIDKNANVAVRIQKTEDSEFLADASSNKNLTDVFSAFSLLQASRSPDKTKISPEPIVIVKADDSLNFGKIVEVIKSLRVSPNQKIKLRISENLSVVIPPPVIEGDFIKPNPAFLLVRLRSDSKIFLNREEQGGFENFLPFKTRLIEVFKDRERFGIFRVGTNELEKTVFVAVPNSVKFSDVIKLVEAVAETGATPIGLPVDEEIPGAPSMVPEK
jgi:biopolymer transport protein ExbD